VDATPRISAAVALTLRQLSDEDLATFRLLLGWPDGKAQCQKQSWWAIVEPLFDGGEVLRTDVADAVDRVVARRLA